MRVEVANQWRAASSGLQNAIAFLELARQRGRVTIDIARNQH